MLKWALMFLVAGLVFAGLGFGGVGGAFIDIAKLLFWVAVIGFVIFAVLAVIAGKKIAGG